MRLISGRSWEALKPERNQPQLGETESWVADRAKNVMRIQSHTPWSLRLRSERKLPAALQQRNNLGQFPHMVTDASGHSRGHAQAAVYPAEIVMDKMERDSAGMCRDGFGKSICQARESAHRHAHSEVVALRVAGANLRRVRTTHDSVFPRSNAFTGRVFAFSTLSIQLDEHSVIHRAVKPCGFDRDKISVVAVRRKLDTVAQPGPQIVSEVVGRLRGTVTDIPRGNEFGFGVDGNPCPAIAPLLCDLLRPAHVAGLRASPSPRIAHDNER